MFHEPELNAFEGQVVVSNQTVAAALANFLAARAMVKQARSQYFPTVSASPSVTRLRQSSVSSSPTSSTFTEYSLPFDASWELDFWGRIRNTVKANSLEAQAALADLENVRLTVQAEVAVDYFQLRVLDAQKQLLDATVLAYQESLKLTQAQYDAGLASAGTSRKPKRNSTPRSRRPPTLASSARCSNTQSRCSSASQLHHFPSLPIR